jgi:hypothetical protein
MTTDPIETVDTSWRGLYRWGGVCMLVVGLLYISSLAFGLGFPPSGAEAILKWLSGKTTLAYAFYGFYALADILLLPAVLALYLALKGINKSAMLVAAGFGGLAVALDLGVNVITQVAMIALSQNYAAATLDVQRTAYLAAATYATAITTVGLPVYSSVILSITTLITGLVMLKGIFSRAAGYVGVATSITGFLYFISLFVPALAVFYGIWGVLIMLWFLLTGYGLLRLGK